jgi:hypothetical protein
VQRQFDLATREWGRQETLNNDAIAFEISMMGRSTLEVQKATAARRIQLALEERIYQIRRKDPDADVSGAILEAQEQITRAQALIDDQWQRQREGWFGATEAIRKYGEEAQNVGSQVESALTNAFHSSEDALVKFATTGKIQLKDLGNLARSIYADILRIQIRKGASEALSSGGLFGGLIKGLFGGGAPSAQGYGTIDAAITESGVLGSFATGTDYVPKTGLYRLHEGEGVTPASENGAGGLTVYADMRGASADAVRRLELFVRRIDGSIERRSVDAWRDARARGERR